MALLEHPTAHRGKPRERTQVDAGVLDVVVDAHHDAVEHVRVCALAIARVLAAEHHVRERLDLRGQLVAQCRIGRDEPAFGLGIAAGAASAVSMFSTVSTGGCGTTFAGGVT